MATENLIETIKRELPELIRSDPALRRFILDLTRETYADRRQTEDRFDRILDELRSDREVQARKWDEQHRKWDEQNRKWDEQNSKWEEESRRWNEQNRKWDEQNSKWEEESRRWNEQNRRWDEQNSKWQESGERFDRLHEEIMAQAKKYDRGIGALGSRWGTQTEAAFRNALAGILEENFGVQVLNVTEYDDEGTVYGRPEQVEIDIIIKNGLLLICELKSSIDKAGMYVFERKARFYENRHNRKANRLMVISPMVDARAQKVAEQLGIEVFSDSVDVKAL